MASPPAGAWACALLTHAMCRCTMSWCDGQSTCRRLGVRLTNTLCEAVQCHVVMDSPPASAWACALLTHAMSGCAMSCCDGQSTCRRLGVRLTNTRYVTLYNVML
ncbi:hypothetical protein NDU88_000241 [Pleurodeles waltl]|uniref:Secreted protein n=1 Tax=Pleurodeles waltl TaxID=8319 RepID=A0AAV7N9R7_PLEWA|nr:hypothetical protein NDU88_000241 [Pleurodeles waltl]